MAIGSRQHDAPEYLAIHQRIFSGAYSCSTNNSSYSGPSLRVYCKAVVLGATLRVGSGGSAAGSNSLYLYRCGTSGTLSVMATKVKTMEAGASAANDIIDISCTTPFTLHSMSEAAMVGGQAASLDKVCVLSDVIFRYRLLPFAEAVEEG